jgi:coenzyme F420-reducing hydrogenase gamma subunit
MKQFAVLQLSGCAGCEVSLLNVRSGWNAISSSICHWSCRRNVVPAVDVLLSAEASARTKTSTSCARR